MARYSGQLRAQRKDLAKGIKILIMLEEKKKKIYTAYNKRKNSNLNNKILKNLKNLKVLESFQKISIHICIWLGSKQVMFYMYLYKVFHADIGGSSIINSYTPQLSVSINRS